MADRWLESLMKVHEKPARIPVASKQADVFSDLFRTGIDDVVVPTIGKVYDGDPDASDVLDPVAVLLEKNVRDKFNIPQFAAPDTVHADGDALEKIGSAIWTRTYRSGTLTKSFVVDPALPGGQAFFNAHGDEISRDDFLAIDEAPIYIEETLGKILGVEDLSPQESLHK